MRSAGGMSASRRSWETVMLGTSQRVSRGLGVVSGSVAVGALVLLSAAISSGSAPTGVTVAPTGGHWLVKDFAYIGEASCASGSCHGADKPKTQSGQNIGDEFTIWSSSGEAGDPHNNAFKTLKTKASSDIAAKLKIDNAAASDRCLTCHTLHVPQAQQKGKYSAESGNSCESCHGPAEKWNTPHATAGWTASERKSKGVAGLVSAYGLLDTSDMALRAELCVSCHLQIDKPLVDAGHPPLQFEMYGYNKYFFDGQFTPHWDEPEGQLITARLWAVGQAASLEAARRQSAAWKAAGDSSAADALVAMYEQGVGIAKKHFGADTADGLNKAALKPEACAAAARDLAETAAGAKTALSRKVIAFGVMALAAASFDGRGQEIPEAVWSAFDKAAPGAEGQAYVDAVKAIAAQAK